MLQLLILHQLGRSTIGVVRVRGCVLLRLRVCDHGLRGIALHLAPASLEVQLLNVHRVLVQVRDVLSGIRLVAGCVAGV